MATSPKQFHDVEYKSAAPWQPRRELATLQFFGPWEREHPVWRAEAWFPAIESHVKNGMWQTW
jgi:hypothetical protein